MATTNHNESPGAVSRETLDTLFAARHSLQRIEAIAGLGRSSNADPQAHVDAWALVEDEATRAAGLLSGRLDMLD